MEILHLTRLSDWEAAVRAGTYELSTRGGTLRQVGFIHASTRSQLPAVAELVFHDVSDDLVVLVMDDADLRNAGADVRFEDGGNGQLYPHIYGPIHPQWVTAVLPAYFDSAGKFQLES
jgi:uncharacterized protein (DUF952 family)